MKPAAVGLLGALALVVAFQLGRESVKAQIRDAFVQAFGGASSSTRPFRIHASDVIQSDFSQRPWLITCPTCAGAPRIQGQDPFDGQPIQCSPCNGNGIADVRAMLRPVVVVPASEPTDYPPGGRRRG